MKIEFISDLMARVPYGVCCKAPHADYPLRIYSIGCESDEWFVQFYSGQKLCSRTPLSEIKPYYRSMSSMTNEEKEYIRNNYFFEDWDSWNDLLHLHWHQLNIDECPNLIRWLYQHKFDFPILNGRELNTWTKLGLALEAPIDLYVR